MGNASFDVGDTLEWNHGQKWLGCILTPCGSTMQHIDLAYYMEQRTKTMHANCWILQTNQPPYMRNFFISMLACQPWSVLELVTVPCTRKQLYALDVLFRKLCRSSVTHPSDTDWSLEWHENSESLAESGSNLHMNSWTVTWVMLCV